MAPCPPFPDYLPAAGRFRLSGQPFWRARTKMGARAWAPLHLLPLALLLLFLPASISREDYISEFLRNGRRVAARKRLRVANSETSHSGSGGCQPMCLQNIEAGVFAMLWEAYPPAMPGQPMLQ